MSSPQRAPRTRDEIIAQSRATIGPADPDEVIIDAGGHRIRGGPRRSANPSYADRRRQHYSDVDRIADGESAGSRMPKGGRYYDPSRSIYQQDGSKAESFSPVALALADARRRRQEYEKTHAIPDPRARSREAAYTADGRRLGKPGAENIFEKRYTEEMKGAAETVFSALNMDAIEAGGTYNVGVETRRETAYGSADSLERQAKNGVNPVRAREVMVQNTIAGGIADFQRMSAQQPDVYNAMVYRLWQAGLISGKVEDAGLGGWTPKAGKALANAMSAVSQLNAQGIPTTMDEYMDSLISGREQALAEFGDDSAAGPAPRSYTSREELNSRLKSTAQEVLGRALSDEEADKFASAFRGKEDGAYDAAEADRDYENPSASASAQTYVEDTHETEAASFRIQGFMERLKSEMGL